MFSCLFYLLWNLTFFILASKESVMGDEDGPLNLVVLGHAGVGKSSLCLRFTMDTFPDDHMTTLITDTWVMTFCIGLLGQTLFNSMHIYESYLLYHMSYDIVYMMEGRGRFSWGFIVPTFTCTNLYLRTISIRTFRIQSQWSFLINPILSPSPYYIPISSFTNRLFTWTQCSSQFWTF